MKEATGELNMTVVTVVAIAAIAAFFYAFVWPAIRNNIQQSTRCASAVCNCTTNQKLCSCNYYDESTGSYTDIQCPNKEYSGN